MRIECVLKTLKKYFIFVINWLFNKTDRQKAREKVKEEKERKKKTLKVLQIFFSHYFRSVIKRLISNE